MQFHENFVDQMLQFQKCFRMSEDSGCFVLNSKEMVEQKKNVGAPDKLQNLKMAIFYFFIRSDIFDKKSQVILIKIKA